MCHTNTFISIAVAQPLPSVGEKKQEEFSKIKKDFLTLIPGGRLLIGLLKMQFHRSGGDNSGSHLFSWSKQ